MTVDFVDTGITNIYLFKPWGKSMFSGFPNALCSSPKLCLRTSPSSFVTELIVRSRVSSTWIRVIILHISFLWLRKLLHCDWPRAGQFIVLNLHCSALQINAREFAIFSVIKKMNYRMKARAIEDVHFLWKFFQSTLVWNWSLCNFESIFKYHS